MPRRSAISIEDVASLDTLAAAVILTGGYWLGETPVTQALWVAVMGETPSGFRGERPDDLQR